MNETLVAAIEFLFEFVELAFAEASLLLFALGFVLGALGLAVLMVALWIYLRARRTNGTIVGAVLDVREKQRVRGGRTETKRKETLWPIFEYADEQGVLRREKGSEGGSGVLAYRTGQTVDLLVLSSRDYDDVYDARSRAPWYMSLGLLLAGSLLMLWAANVWAVLGVGAVGLATILLGLLARILAGAGRRRTRERERPHLKHFDEADVRPIEHFAALRDGASGAAGGD